MDSPEERILAYPHLSSEEKKNVEAYVETHPEWASLLQDVKALEELAHEARRLHQWPPDDEVLATYAVAQVLYPDAIPSSLREAFDRLERRLKSEDELRARYEDIQARIEALDEAFDPRSHFEELTGHSFSRDANESASDAGFENEAERDRSSTVREPVARSRTPSERGIGRLFASVGQWAAAAGVVLALAYGVLFVASSLSQDPLERLAAVEVDQDVLESYQVRTRGVAPAPGSTSVDRTYLQALRLLDGSRTTTLGLFPRYDAEKLRKAEALLSEVASRTGDGSFLQLEALFYLGKVQLAQGEVEAARSNLKTVVQREGHRAGEAYRILKELQQDVAPR